jgi:hypothetical protein
MAGVCRPYRRPDVWLSPKDRTVAARGRRPCEGSTAPASGPQPEAKDQPATGSRDHQRPPPVRTECARANAGSTGTNQGARRALASRQADQKPEGVRGSRRRLARRTAVGEATPAVGAGRRGFSTNDQHVQQERRGAEAVPALEPVLAVDRRTVAHGTRAAARDAVRRDGLRQIAAGPGR